MAVVDLDERLCLLAGRLRAGHHRRRSSEVSMADCLVLATAIVQDDRLATADPALAAMARTEGVDVVDLPDSSGRRP